MELEVGVRELRQHLAQWLQRAAGGESILVTERGRPLARLGPADEHRHLDELEREGLVTRASKPRTDVRGVPGVPVEGEVASIVTDQRR